MYSMNLNNPKISIIIANYNNGHFFKDCYDSLIRQTESNWEAIVIDDCSTDNSKFLIKDLIKDDQRFKFYENAHNLGYQKTLIKAIEFSSSEIFGRLDPDDSLNKRAIELSLNEHKIFSEVGLVYSNFIFCDKDLKPYKIHKTKDLIDERMFLIGGEISHFATFKKKFYNQTTGIDYKNRRAEDQDIYMKMCEIAPVKRIDKELYNYRVHGGGVSTNSNSDKALFWNWVAIIKASERRNINVEDLFLENFVRKSTYDDEIIKNNNLRTLLKKSRWLKIGAKLGIFKLYKYL